MKRSLALLLPTVVAALACSDTHLATTRDAGSDAGGLSSSDAGDDRDGGTSPDVLRRRTAALVTAPPRYVLVGESYRYRPKANVALDSLAVSEGPRDLALRDAVLTWQPSEAQAGRHRVVLSGTSQSGGFSQEFDIDVATSTLRVAGDVSPTEGGRVLASDVARQQLAGVGVSVPAGAVQSSIRVSVSEIDLAPNIPNSAGRTRAMRFGPAGTVFDTPAQVFLPMPDDVAISRARLGAYVYDESGRWVRVPITAVDVDNRLVAARARHFSAYAIAQSDRALTASLEPSGETSACAGDLVGRARLETPLTLKLSSVNNLPDTLRALFASEDATVEELLLASGMRGSLRMVQVFGLREAGGDLALEQVVLVTTVHAPGDASLTVSQTDALGNLVGQRRFANATEALAEITQRLAGAATAAHFSSPTGKDRTLAVRVHLAFAPGDASLEPVDVHDLGPACADAEAVAYDDRTVADDDRDCDGVRDAFDATDDSLAPRLDVSPRQVVRAFPGEPVTLRARVIGAATPARWALLDQRTAQLTEIAGSSEARAFTAPAEGRYLVSYRAGSDPNVLEHMFAIDVIAHPAVDTPPRCRPTKDVASGIVGQAIALSAVASDDETPTNALRIEWGLYDPTSGGLVSAPELIGANESARLLASAPGKFVLGCRAFDGQLQGGVGTLEVAIEAARNRPPELTISPLEVTVTRGRTIVLRAFASDPEGDTLSFTWRVDGSEVPAASAATESRLELTPTRAGDLTIEATVRDVSSQVRGRATVHVRDPDAPPVDADGDGYSPDAAAARDCDDGAASVHPGASEQCNTRDDDCDGLVDEDGVCTTTCAAGFVSDGAGGCVDVDECALNGGGCDPLVACVNMPGSYVCGKCPSGYAGTGASSCTDIDECASNHGGCDPLVACTNTPGSFRCGDCPSGYTGGGATSCTDIDECADGNGGCDPLAVCVNTPGGRACGSCPPGYAGSGESGCTDVNECALEHGRCDPRTTCTNTAGGRRCGACPSGFAGTGETGCADIDECTSGSARCDPLTTCLNAEGGYGCSDCPPGFLGSGISGCVDVDECASNHGGCDPNVACINGAGSFRCGDCPSGYVGSGDTGCVDVDECANDTDGCDPLAACTNTPGSYRCGDCPAGYTGGMAGCSDIDECANNRGGCSELRPCVNDPGGYHCDPCRPGYTERGTTDCADIDECAGTTAPCTGGRRCINTIGEFECVCPAGFAWIDERCVDVDECQKAPCHPTAQCENLVGSYQCTCPPGTFDDTGDATYCGHAVLLRSGSNATCAITETKGLFCWGGAYPSTPIRVGLAGVGYDPRALGRADWVDVDVADHTCAIQDGALYCWGPNQSGMLGLGNNTDTGLEPRMVGKDTDWMQVSVGAKHTCALKTSGAMYCWGANDFGQLGADLKTTSVNVPRLLAQSGWSLLSAGVFHNCARQPSGTVACWGYNGFGGTGVLPILGRTEQPEPSQVDVKAGFSELAVGNEHACGLRDGALFCWGGNGRGQLGLGSDLESLLISQIGRLASWTGISAAMWSSCGISAGALACWGDIEGSGPVRAPAQVGKDTDWTHVAAGYQHVCAVRKERVYCFGRNKFGQLGDGSDKDALAPALTPVFAGRPR